MNLNFISLAEAAELNLRDLAYKSGCCGCCDETPVVVPPVVEPTPVVTITPSTRAIDSGQVASFTASADISGSTFKWYDAATGGNELASTASFTSPALTTGKTYYAQATSPAGKVSTRVGAAVTINSLPVPSITITPTSRSIVSGQTTTFTASSNITGSTFNWYDSATGGSPLYTGATFTTPALTQSRSYYASATSPAGQTSSRATATVVVQAITNPTYTAPSANLTSSTSTTPSEVGTALSVNLTLNFTQNDAGSVTSRSMKKNSVVTGSVSSSGVYTETLNIGATATTYQGSVAYAQGPMKQDSTGADYPTGRIAAGSIDTSNTITIPAGQYKAFFGAVDGAITTANARTFGSNAFVGTSVFTFNTGNTARNFHFLLPPGYALDTVIYVFSGIEVHMEDQFVSSTIQVADAGGTNRTYTKYTMTNGIAYTTAQNWSVKFKTI